MRLWLTNTPIFSLLFKLSDIARLLVWNQVTWHISESRTESICSWTRYCDVFTDVPHAWTFTWAETPLGWILKGRLCKFGHVGARSRHIKPAWSRYLIALWLSNGVDTLCFTQHVKVRVVMVRTRLLLHLLSFKTVIEFGPKYICRSVSHGRWWLVLAGSWHKGSRLTHLRAFTVAEPSRWGLNPSLLIGGVVNVWRRQLMDKFVL